MTHSDNMAEAIAETLFTTKNVGINDVIKATELYCQKVNNRIEFTAWRKQWPESNKALQELKRNIHTRRVEFQNADGERN